MSKMSDNAIAHPTYNPFYELLPDDWLKSPVPNKPSEGEVLILLGSGAKAPPVV